jgi:hypothetical protein
MIGKAEVILVTPNTLTETSNLLGQIGEPIRSQLFQYFSTLIKAVDTEEVFIAGRVAAASEEFIRLGLTDCAVLEATSSHLLLTAELKLYHAALSRGMRAENFNNHRNL